MSITATCTSCGRNFFAPAKFAGKRVKCKGCGEIFAVPSMGVTQNGYDPHGETDPLSQLASVVTSESSAEFQRSPFEESDSDQESEESAYNGNPKKSALAPNVLTFSYPGADDVDRWLPIALIVVGFLLLLTMSNGPETNGFAWIAFTRFLAPSVLFVAFTFPITLAMIRKAAVELRYAMPPNFRMRCFAAYMPPFMLMTWAQFAGEGLTIVQLFAALLGLGISSLLVWLLFRLREEHIGTTAVYGAGGFAAGAAICCALLLGFNKIGALVVTDQHAIASVPISPFGSGFSWPSLPPPVKPTPAPTVAVNPAPVDPASTANTVVATSPAPVLTKTAALGQFDPGTVPGVIGDVIDPLDDSPFVCILRTNQNGGIAIESWNTQTWEQAPSTLQLPNRPAGNMAISTDGQRLAWIAEFPRLSVQIWSFATGTVVSSVDLDRANGPVNLVGFIGDNKLLIDGIPPAAPVDVAPPPTDRIHRHQNHRSKSKHPNPTFSMT